MTYYPRPLDGSRSSIFSGIDTESGGLEVYRLSRVFSAAGRKDFIKENRRRQSSFEYLLCPYNNTIYNKAIGDFVRPKILFMEFKNRIVRKTFQPMVYVRNRKIDKNLSETV